MLFIFVKVTFTRKKIYLFLLKSFISNFYFFLSFFFFFFFILVACSSTVSIALFVANFAYLNFALNILPDTRELMTFISGNI